MSDAMESNAEGNVILHQSDKCGKCNREKL